MDVYLTGHHRTPARELCGFLTDRKIEVRSAWHHFNLDWCHPVITVSKKEESERAKHEPTHYAIADSVLFVFGEGDQEELTPGMVPLEYAKSKGKPVATLWGSIEGLTELEDWYAVERWLKG